VEAAPVGDRGLSHRVLECAVPVLVEHGCAFKFAVSPQVIADLTAVRASRSQSGKFLTVIYPVDDEQLRAVAGSLHRATLSLVRPVILSDRRYRPDSLVSYRYDGFVSARVIRGEQGQLNWPSPASTTAKLALASRAET
jgi:hypothetical protein